MTEKESRRHFLQKFAVTVPALSLTGLTLSATAEQAPVIDEHTPPPKGMADDLLAHFKLGDEKIHPLDVVTSKGRAFQAVDLHKDKETGARFLSVREVAPQDEDGLTSSRTLLPPVTDELHLVFPGRSNSIWGTKAENAVVEDIFFKEGHQRQSDVISAYVENSVKPYLKNNTVDSVDIHAHSLGVGSALIAKHLLDPVVPVKATLFEPLGAAQVAMSIAGDAVKTSAETPEQVFDRLRRNVTSVRSYPSTLIADLSVGKSTVGNMQFGDRAFILNASSELPNRKSLKPRGREIGAALGLATAAKGLTKWADAPAFSRRKLLGAAATLALPPTAAVSGELTEEILHEAYHRLNICSALLEANGDQAIITAKGKGLLAGNAELMHPEKHPLRLKDKLAETATEVFLRL